LIKLSDIFAVLIDDCFFEKSNLNFYKNKVL